MSASGTTQTSHGFFALSKLKVTLLLSLALTWWVAHLLPRYEHSIRTKVTHVATSVSSRLQEARRQIPAIKVDWTVPDDARADFDASKVALLIEPRPLPHLVPLILHMISVVPPDWRFVVVGSDKSIFSLNRAYAIKHQQVIGKLDLLVLPEPWNISSKEMVHRVMTDIRFYDEFLPSVEWILKYEHDSILCANSPKSLNDWLDWAWAGAPKDPTDRFSGNGGLSLRKVSAIRRVLKFQARFNNSDPEDEWFGRRLWVMPGEKVTSGLTALAVEGVYIEKPMGFHVPDGGRSLADAVWKKADQRKKIFEYCPELALIMDMKLERERCEFDNHEGEIINPEEEKKKAEEEKKEKEEKQKQEAEAKKKEDAKGGEKKEGEPKEEKKEGEPKEEKEGEPKEEKEEDEPKEEKKEGEKKEEEKKEGEPKEEKKEGEPKEEKKEEEKKEEEKKEEVKKEEEKKEEPTDSSPA